MWRTTLSPSSFPVSRKRHLWITVRDQNNDNREKCQKCTANKFLNQKKIHTEIRNKITYLKCFAIIAFVNSLDIWNLQQSWFETVRSLQEKRSYIRPKYARDLLFMSDRIRSLDRQVLSKEKNFYASKDSQFLVHTYCLWKLLICHAYLYILCQMQILEGMLRYFCNIRFKF